MRKPIPPSDGYFSVDYKKDPNAVPEQPVFQVIAYRQSDDYLAPKLLTLRLGMERDDAVELSHAFRQVLGERIDEFVY